MVLKLLWVAPRPLALSRSLLEYWIFGSCPEKLRYNLHLTSYPREMCMYSNIWEHHFLKLQIFELHTQRFFISKSPAVSRNLQPNRHPRSLEHWWSWDYTFRNRAYCDGQPRCMKINMKEVLGTQLSQPNASWMVARTVLSEPEEYF